MVWDNLDDLFEDLEAQAEGLHLAERDAELADRSLGEYASVTMAGRLHASVGTAISVKVAGVGGLQGRLLRVGSDWCLVSAEPSGQEWVVRLAAVTEVSGAAHGAVGEPARPVTTRLGLRSALREMVEAGVVVVAWLGDGTQHRGLPLRVGADFVEIAAESDPPAQRLLLLPFDALAAFTG